MFRITRRQFLKWLTASAAALGLSQTDLLKVEKAFAALPGPTPDPLMPLGPTLLNVNAGTLARVIWIAGAACSGCPTSLLNYLADPNDPEAVLNTIANNAIPGYPLVDLNALYPNQDNLLGAPVTPEIDIAEVVLEIITIDYAQIVMAASGDLPNNWMRQLRNAGGYVLLVEGTIQTAANGKYCRVVDMPDDGTIAGGPWDPYMKYYNDPALGGNRCEMTMAGATLWLAQNAAAVVTLGTCAAFGGVPAAKGTVTGGKSAWEWINQANAMNKLMVNIPGCPPNPDWVIATVGAALLELNGVIPGILLNNLDTSLDHKDRPKLTYIPVYHQDAAYAFCEDCPRRGAGDAVSIADGQKKAGQPDGKCLNNMGCNGWLVGEAHIRPDCPTRMWNKFEDMSKNNWCVKNNMPCQGCTSPGFPDLCSPFYSKNKGY